MAKPGPKEGSERPDLLKYDAEKYPEMAHKLCLLGATNAQMADFFQVNEETIYRWMNEYQDFKDALTAGKMVADAEIAHALYHRAKGYSHKDTKMFVSHGEEGATILTQDYMKHYPPDTQACRWWLNNRQKDIWRERSELDVNVSGDKATRLIAAKKRMNGDG